MEFGWLLQASGDLLVGSARWLGRQSTGALAVGAAVFALLAAGLYWGPLRRRRRQRTPARQVQTRALKEELRIRLAARSPLGFVSVANGGLGFAIPAAIGLRMACPGRPVVAIVGDGSSLYSIQALWTAARYRIGVLFVILANGGYAIMDRLAEQQGGDRAWPGFGDIDIAGLATSLTCPALRVTGHDELLATLDDVIPGLASRTEPLLLEVVVAPDPGFEP